MHLIECRWFNPVFSRETTWSEENFKFQIDKNIFFDVIVIIIHVELVGYIFIKYGYGNVEISIR